LCSVAKILLSVFDKVYRLSGDEFVVGGEDLVELIRSAEAAQYESPFISYGVGRNLTEANARLNMSKKVIEETNLRSPRGVKPPWIEQFKTSLRKRIESDD